MQATGLSDMKRLLETALQAVRLEDVKVKIDESGEYLEVADGTISVAQCVVEKGTRTGTRAFPGWEVYWWTYTPGGVPNWDDPPEVCEKELYRGLSPYKAATTIALSLHEDRLQAVYENLEYESVP